MMILYLFFIIPVLFLLPFGKYNVVYSFELDVILICFIIVSFGGSIFIWLDVPGICNLYFPISDRVILQHIGPISGSIVRNYKLESQIFPDQVTTIAIGAQAKGGQLGIQNNTMIDFNLQLTDRIIPKKAEELNVNNASGGNSLATPTLGGGLIDIVILLAICYQGALENNSAYNTASSKAKRVTTPMTISRNLSNRVSSMNYSHLLPLLSVKLIIVNMCCKKFGID